MNKKELSTIGWTLYQNFLYFTTQYHTETN